MNIDDINTCPICHDDLISDIESLDNTGNMNFWNRKLCNRFAGAAEFCIGWLARDHKRQVAWIAYRIGNHRICVNYDECNTDIAFNDKTIIIPHCIKILDPYDVGFVFKKSKMILTFS